MAGAVPNSDFQSHGFQYDGLQENRAANFAVDYWHARFDLDKKAASLKGLQEQLKQVKFSFKRATETNLQMRKDIKAKDGELEDTRREISQLREELRREKQNYGVQARMLSKNRIHIDALETELAKRSADLKDAQVQITQLLQTHKEEAAKDAQKIHMLSERNANLSISLNNIREIEEHTKRQLDDMRVERDHLVRKVGTQQNMLDFRENSHFSVREQQRPAEDFQALEEAYEELHGKLEVMWAERDDALAKVQVLSKERDLMMSKIMARGLQHTLV